MLSTFTKFTFVGPGLPLSKLSLFFSILKEQYLLLNFHFPDSLSDVNM